MNRSRPIIGLLGGMGWPSTGHYYRTINALAGDRHQTIHVLADSLAFDDLLTIAETDGFDAVGDVLAAEARRLEHAGADVIVLCAVTAHLVHRQVADAVDRPVPHIGRSINRHLEAHSAATFGLLGTKPALSGDALGLKAARLLPSRDHLEALDRAIRHDIAFGRIGPPQIDIVKRAVSDLERKGATDIVLACTELPLLADRLETDLPKIDAVVLHCRSALDQVGVVSGSNARRRTP